MKKRTFILPLFLIATSLVNDSSTNILPNDVLQIVANSTREEDAESYRLISEMVLSSNNSDIFLLSNAVSVKNDISIIMKELINKSLEPNAVVDYILQKKNNVEFELAISMFFCEKEFESQLAFLDIVASSKIDIFERWYKEILLFGSESEDIELKTFCNDMLELYSDVYSKVL